MSADQENNELSQSTPSDPATQPANDGRGVPRTDEAAGVGISLSLDVPSRSSAIVRLRCAKLTR